MNRLSQKIAAAVDARVETGPGLILAELANHRLRLHVATGGPVGLALDCLEYQAIDHHPLSHSELKAWGDRLALKLTYLMEPLIVLEVDAEGGQAELRSEAPTQREGRRTYYELRLNRSAALKLGRICYDESTRKRENIPCQLTREALERLADDLAASFD